MDIQPIENSIKFGGQNATYDVSNESPNAAEFVASFNLVPVNDVDGQLRVHVAFGSREIALNAGSGNGTGGTIRLNKFFTDWDRSSSKSQSSYNYRNHLCPNYSDREPVSAY
ncbi:MAG: hypothetical protein AB8U82_06515 [Rickettsia endosymbiont of Haemaphysalis japonica]